MKRCEVRLGASNMLVDAEFLQATLNCSFGDVETEIVVKFLERHASELQGDSGKVSVITLGCGALYCLRGPRCFNCVLVYLRRRREMVDC